MPRPITRRFLLATALVACGAATAGPMIEPGDLALRHDIQRLADFGIVTSPVTTWPLEWGPILADIEAYTGQATSPPDVADALLRVRNRADWHAQTHVVRYRARLAVAESPARIRSFQDTPRGKSEIGAGFTYTGEWLTVDLNVTGSIDDNDSQDVRLDGSQIGVAIHNWTLAASTLDRWWGPAWDNNLILTNNARPLAAITIDRRYTEAFEPRWLSWIGPWDMSLLLGQLESDRAIPDARFLGWRFSFRPVQSLEIGLSRTALWCGENRSCDFETFWNLLLGRDNRGDDDITVENEPGDQTAALDFRWNLPFFDRRLALYGQFMAEDEAGGFPSRYLGQFGAEGTGILRGKWSYRWYTELSETSCDFLESPERFGCAYNHFIYQTGYRFRGRSIGHSADNDAALATIGIVLVDTAENSWQAHVRNGVLNRGGFPNSRNTVATGKQDYSGVELIHNRVFHYGRLEAGIGYDIFGGNDLAQSSNEFRAFVQWRSDR